MKDMHPDIIDLLVLRATEGLSDAESEALATLLSQHGLEDTLELDLAAAAATNAFALRDVQEARPAPEALKAKLRDNADRFFAGQKVVPFPAGKRAAASDASRRNFGWAVAAMLAVALLFSNFADFSRSGPGAEAARQRLIADSADTAIIPWSQPEDPAYRNVTGNVVWNDEKQEGYLLLAGMPVNDPGQSQYQLWVVDPDRDTNPVDGGVFDIPAGVDRVIIPIDAKLAVSKPAVFAITREQPGGVVVSKGPLLVVASAG